MEIKQMIYFKEVAEAKSFTIAADNLYITPQALNKSMHIMQQEFPTAIFYRQNGKLELTNFGKILYEEVTAILVNISNMQTRLNNIALQENGIIKIAIAHGLLQGTFQNKIKQFQQKHPKINLDIIELPDVFVENTVLHDDYDFGIGINIPIEPNYFNYQLIEHHQICAVVHNDNHLFHNKTISLKECAQYPIITKNRIFKIYHALENSVKKQGIHINYALTSSDEIK